MLNNIYLICGKSGSGKTTVVEKLEQDCGYHVLKSHTTRKPRHPNDTDHIYSEISDYMIAKENNTIMASTVFDHNYYWATREQLDDCDLYVIDNRMFYHHFKSSNELCTAGLFTYDSESISKKHRKMKCK